MAIEVVLPRLNSYVFFKPEDQPEMLLQVFACETRILDYYDNDIDLGILIPIKT